MIYLIVSVDLLVHGEPTKLLQEERLLLPGQVLQQLLGMGHPLDRKLVSCCQVKSIVKGLTWHMTGLEE